MSVYKQAKEKAAKEMYELGRQLQNDNAELKRLNDAADQLRNRIARIEEERERLLHLFNSLDVAARDAEGKEEVCEQS